MIKNYAEWKAKLGKFVTYSKELDQKVEILPEKFVIVDENFGIKGWNMKQNTMMYSNRIKNFNEDEFVVRTKNGELLKSKYNQETKLKFKDLGGRLYKAIVVYENGELNEYQLEGTALFEYNKNRTKLNPEKYFTKLEDVITGDRWFKNPKFVNGEELTPELKSEVNKKFKEHLEEIEEKKQSYNNQSKDLPF